MAVDIKADVISSQITQPPRLLIYGQHGLGKTTLGCSFPAPILINMEKGTPVGIDVPATPMITDYQTILDWFRALILDEHDFRTVVVDTLDIMEPLLHDYVCKKHGWKSIEDPGYGKGYVAAAEEWTNFMRACRAMNEKRGLCVVLLAHAQVSRFDDPTADSYSTYEIRLDKRGRAIVGDLCDAIFFLNQTVTVKEEKGQLGAPKKAVGNGNVWAFTRPKPAWNAKNPYEMPEKVLIPKDDPYGALAPYLPGMGSEE